MIFVLIKRQTTRLFTEYQQFFNNVNANTYTHLHMCVYSYTHEHEHTRTHAVTNKITTENYCSAFYNPKDIKNTQLGRGR